MGTGRGTGAGTAEPFACRPVGQIEGASGSDRWLIESLWADQGVGIVGGTPKTGKTWAALELALSVASGTAAFGRFQVSEPGPVVIYPAEDRPADIRDRVELLARHRGLDLSGLPLHLIEADRVHLDDDSDRRRLEALLETRQPKLLVLDPLVRLHTGSESTAQHVAALLGYLRSLQRRFELSVMVTHHLAKQKSKAAGIQPGQALRGSSDLHAWGDSNLYLTRHPRGVVELHAEQRNAASLEDPLFYRLSVIDSGAHLELVDGPQVEPSLASGDGELPVLELVPQPRRAARAISDQVLGLLEARAPLSQVSIRKLLRVRNQALTDVLRSLEVEGFVARGSKGWSLVPPQAEIDARPPSDLGPNPET